MATLRLMEVKRLSLKCKSPAFLVGPRYILSSDPQQSAFCTWARGQQLPWLLSRRKGLSTACHHPVCTQRSLSQLDKGESGSL